MSTQPLPGTAAGTEYHWVIAAQIGNAIGTYDGVIVLSGPTTRASVYAKLKAAVAAEVEKRTGSPEYGLIFFSLKPNAIIPGGAQSATTATA